MTVGKNDVFERKYMDRFQNFASQFGEFAKYERDRGARDIGIHFTRKTKGGNEMLAPAFCWFQMKGIMDNTLPIEEYNKLTYVTIQIKTEHLKFWFVQNMPTYLIIYRKCRYISNSKYACLYSRKWGINIFQLSRETVKVSVPKQSVLDKQAFDIIIRNSDAESWSRLLNQTTYTTNILIRDYNIIYNIGTASKRNNQFILTLKEWVSKSRSEINFLYKQSSDTEWINLREHWGYLASIEEIDEFYPYLNFIDWSEEDNEEIDSDFKEYVNTVYKSLDYDLFFLNNRYHKEHFFKSGKRAVGLNHSSKYFLFVMKIELNQLGLELLEQIQVLLDANIIQTNVDREKIIGITPWNKREV